MYKILSIIFSILITILIIYYNYYWNNINPYNTVESFDISKNDIMAVSYKDKHLKNQIYLSNLKGQNLKIINQPYNNNTKPRFSDDWNKISFVSHINNIDKLYTYNIKSNKYTRVLEKISPDKNACSWIRDTIFSNDSKYLFILFNQEWTETFGEWEKGDFSILKINEDWSDLQKITNLEKNDRCLLEYLSIDGSGIILVSKTNEALDMLNKYNLWSDKGVKYAKIYNEQIFFIQDKNFPTCSIRFSKNELWTIGINGNWLKKINLEIK